jgi:hypothetical protein
MVRATRMTSHQAQRDRIMRLAEDGAVEVGAPVTPWERSVLLEWLTAIFGRLGREIALILVPASQDELATMLGQIKHRIRFLREDLTSRDLGPSTL